METGITMDRMAAYWREELGKAVSSEESRAICYCANVHLPTPEGALAPGVFIHIEHVDASCEDVFYPYRKGEDSKVIFGEPATEGAEQEILGPPQQRT